jgi:hypothetical protein
LVSRAAQGFFASAANDAEREGLARLRLEQPRSVRDHLYRALVLRALRESRHP